MAIMTFIKSVIPVLVKKCVWLEGWTDPEDIMNHTLARTYFLKMLTLFVLIINQERAANKQFVCVESVLALTFYKLIIINSLSALATNIIMYKALFCLAGGDANKDAKFQFDHEAVSQGYIDLNYNQGLFLIGILYAPMLPILWVAMNALEFAALIFCLKNYCRLAEKPYESKDANITLWYLSATWLICAVPTANFLASPPSTNCAHDDKRLCVCGPFSPDIPMKYYALANCASAEIGTLIDTIYAYMLNPMIVYGAIMCLIIVIMWYHTILSQVRGQCVDTYMANFLLTKDKQRLVARLNDAEQKRRQDIADLERELGDKKTD